MEITWHGDSCVTVTGKEKSLVINPTREAGGLKGDIVLSSLKNTAKVAGTKRIFDWPGEYEMMGVPIFGIATPTTTIFQFKFDKIKICHLGHTTEALSSDTIKQIGNVDILIIDATEGSDLSTKQAMEIVEAIDPRVVIPIGSGDSAAFLKELGAEGVVPEPKFIVKSASALPTETRQNVVLEKA